MWRPVGWGVNQGADFSIIQRKSNLFSVSPAKEKELSNRMQRLGVHPEDLEESFVRSSGAGGQHVNKTSTCVWLRHSQTGLEVKCQISRSQAMNRFLARRLLLDKIETQVLGKRSEEQKRIEKIRRQKRRRSRRAKEKMLADKRRRSEKKSLRQKPGF
ncbi:MAG: peptide chain release factor-like protein [Deltaproteobacteria bacterium]|nr:peptide chain release factor-like protein [Deltaproteobacteria bacterium]